LTVVSLERRASGDHSRPGETVTPTGRPAARAELGWNQADQAPRRAKPAALQLPGLPITDMLNLLPILPCECRRC